MSDLAKVLDERQAETQDIVFPIRELRVIDKTHVNVLGEDYKLNPKSFRQLCELVDIPFPYAKRCPNDLLVDNINFWLNSKNTSVHSALVNDKGVRAFKNPAYSYVSSAAIYEAITSLVSDDFQIGNYHIDEDVVEFIVFSPEYNLEVVDSPIKAGLSVLHSDSWAVFPRFDTYLLREWCSNGATHEVGHRKYRVSGKSEEEIVEQAKVFATESLAQIPQMIEGFKQLVNQEVDNWVALVSRICTENHLPKKIKKIILETAHLPEFLATMTDGKIATMYHVVNLITFVASHSDEISQDHRQHLFNIAGSIMVTNDTRCVQCGTTIS